MWVKAALKNFDEIELKDAVFGFRLENQIQIRSKLDPLAQPKKPLSSDIFVCL